MFGCRPFCKPAENDFEKITIVKRSIYHMMHVNTIGVRDWKVKLLKQGLFWAL